MILDRLKVRGKLNLLLLLPLAAVVLVAVPFITGQVDNARSAVATATAASQAHQLGALVWELQRERLVSAGYLASPTSDSVDLLLAQQAVDDTAEALRASLGSGASDELVEALARVGSLAELRQGALEHGASLDSVARAYHAVIDAVIQALRLVPQKTSDAEGTRQLTALDALLRANEQNALRGMSLIVAAVSPQTGLALLNDASAQAQMFTEQFVEQADINHASLVVLVDQGEAARRVAALAARLPQPHTGAIESFVAEALAAAESQAGLRRLVQDRVTRQIADAAAGRANAAQAVAWSVGLGTSVLVVVVMALLVVVSRSIANPLHRLTRAAATVADLTNAELVRVTDEERAAEQPPQLAAIEVSSGDEIGELAEAFNRVQATAALLVERQTVTRRNVSLMFTNVAQRTRNLVGQQLAVVDELERNEQNPQLLGRLYRLDHLSTRLRRNAENLLVVAGARTDARVKGPTPLATVLRAALTEIEEYQRVRFGHVREVTVDASPASDLVLVFAELLENAVVFSPPESLVDVQADVSSEGFCRVSIVDHGIGMTPARMAQENHRLVERERLDIAPTSVLGLFVVGRIARRHGLTVELAPTSGGGTTAFVAIPPALFSHGARPDTFALPGATDVGRARVGAATSPHSLTLSFPPPLALSVSTGPGDGFRWFSQDPHRAPDFASGPAAADRPHRNGPPPEAREASHRMASATPRAAGAGAHAGLARRVPGASLAPDIRAQPPGTPIQRGAPWQARDPHAVREAFDSYTTGLALGLQQRPGTTVDHTMGKENQE